MGIFLKNYERKNWQQVLPLHLVWQEKNQTDKDLFVHFVPPLYSKKKEFRRCWWWMEKNGFPCLSLMRFW